jgi:hypothetical protein
MAVNEYLHLHRHNFDDTLAKFDVGHLLRLDWWLSIQLCQMMLLPSKTNGAPPRCQNQQYLP